MQRVARFARYWELVGNSGRFARAVPLLTGARPFERFMRFSDWLYARTGKTHEFALERLHQFLFDFMTGELGIERGAAGGALLADYQASGARGRLGFADPGLQIVVEDGPTASSVGLPRRTARHARS